jgi:cellulose synthase/poly-beta-1,6-N-acetylglucosamine synthase-like glycosyltransferase
MNVVLWMVAALPVAAACYAYAVYPALLWLFARRAKARPAAPEWTPLVTYVIPAYNEAAQIRGAIESLLAQDYPAERKQILVVSDASTDGSDDIARAYADRGVELLRMEERCGKTAAENRAAAHVRGEIVINSDASVRLHPLATRRLVSAMADPDVGVASTRDVSVAAGQTSSIAAEAGYVGYEMWVRDLETRAGGIIGASGSGYAIRAELHKLPVREDLSRDFSSALTARRHGLRAVSVSDAVTYVPRTESVRREYRRKVRTISRGLKTIHANRDLLDPRRHGWFAYKLITHKLNRWLVPVLGVPALVALALLAYRYHAGALALSAIAALAICAHVALRHDDRADAPALPRTVFGMLAANAAVVHASWRFVWQAEDRIWEPTRRTPAATTLPVSSPLPGGQLPLQES